MNEIGGNQSQRHDMKEHRKNSKDEGEKDGGNETEGSSENGNVQDFECYDGWAEGEEEQSRYVQKMNDKRRSKIERGVKTLRDLLEKMNHRPIGTHLLIAAAKDESGFPDLLALLVRHNGTLAIEEDVTLEVAKNPYGYRMMEFLLDYRKDLLITNEMLTAAVAIENEDFSELMQVDKSRKLVLEAILQHVPHINIGGEIFEVAAKNLEIGVELIALLLKHRSLHVTEAVLSAAVTNERCGTSIVTALLQHQSNIDVTVNVLVAAFANKKCGADIVKKFLEYRSIKITDDVIQTVLQETGQSMSTTRVMLAHGSGSDIPEETIAQARARMNSTDFVDFLLRLKGDLVTSRPEEKDISMNVLSTRMEQSTVQDISANCMTCLGLGPDLIVMKNNYLLSWDDLLRTGQAGCRHCRLIQRCIDQIRERLETGLHLDSYINLSRTTRGFLSLEINGLHFEVYRHADSSDYYSNIGIGRDISEHASANECITLATRWMTECIDTHPKCLTSSGASSLPTRVINVGSKEVEPNLYVSSGEKLPYVTLSHYWGKGVMVTTTLSTLEGRKREIPLSILPSTFQDAIVITRRLGIQYIWIDSLCIIQDSAEDWSKEAAKMADVYLRSTVTIAADGKLSNGGTCYSPFDSTCKTRNISIPVPCLDNNGIECLVYVRRQMDRINLAIGGGAAYTYQDHPWQIFKTELNTRGWTFQERLLAPRTLHYSPAELAWECGTQLCFESSLAPLILARIEDAYKTQFFGNTKSNVQGAKGERMDNTYRSTQWDSMVSSFTHRKLSYESDRLPAISGLAKLLKIGPDDEYVCGLWRNTLARELLWEAESHATQNGTALSRRQEQFQAPSWSWASVTGPIALRRHTEQYQENWKEVVYVLNVSYALATLNLFGPVTHGYLTLRGSLVPVWHKYTSGTSGFDLYFGSQTSNNQKLTIQLGECRWDVIEDDRYTCAEVDRDDTLFLLPVSKCPGPTNTAPACIILKAAQGGIDRFQRVGVLKESLETIISLRNAFWGLWFEIAELRTFVIM